MSIERRSFRHENVDATPTNSQGQPQDIITFLAIAQDAEIDFLPITWPRGVSGGIVTGGTAKVRESRVRLEMSFAFKAVKDVERIDKRPTRIKARFKELISEIQIGRASCRERV